MAEVKREHAVDFPEVLREELWDIEESRAHRLRGERPPYQEKSPDNPNLNKRAFDQNLIGLALSGGGIRSATFSLGVIQELAQRKLLKQVDYLSTVSGGGYIGSWLASWIKRDSFEDVCKKLDPDGPDRTTEATPITFLRQYSNYLTPRVSFFNADTWLVAAIWLRNTILNLAILVSALASIMLLLRLLGGRWAQATWPKPDEVWWPLAISMLFLSPTLFYICRELLRVSRAALNLSTEKWGDSDSDKGALWFLTGEVISSAMLSLWLWRSSDRFVNGTLWHGVWPNFLALSIAFALLQLCCLFGKCYAERESAEKRQSQVLFYFWGIGSWLFPCIAAVVTALLLRGVACIFAATPTEQQPWFAFVWGPPLVTLAFSLGVVVHVGLMGRDLPEGCREWLSRIRAWTFIITVFWVIVVGGSFYGPYLVLLLTSGGGHAKTDWTALISWVATTIGGLFAAKSSQTNGKVEQGSEPSKAKIPLELLARVAPFVFMGGFILAVAFGFHALLVHNLEAPPSESVHAAAERYTFELKTNQLIAIRQPAANETALDAMKEKYWNHLCLTRLLPSDLPGWMTGLLPESITSPQPCPGIDCLWYQFVAPSKDLWPFSALFPLLGLCFIACLLLSSRVDLNDFSMYHFYRNRLVRCYLGASHTDRNPNPFTGFDDDDDVELWRLCAKPIGKKPSRRDGKPYYGPYPILNAALNVSSGGDLKYQERKALSYTFTPHYSGYATDTTSNQMRLRDDSLHNDDAAKPAYRPTDECATTGIKVGMATAISGAAVNPNMGYHTSTAVAFLLAVFNVRLGWWLGNPMQDDHFNKWGPRFGLLYTVLELFGLANANRAFVNLSDGGHFDNMGIYELVRRRCRYIICCDGEQDAEMTFSGIGNAIRKCRTDLQVEIELPLEPLKLKEDFSQAHCVVGKIRYPEQPGQCGYLVYLKSSLTGDEPSDVLEYRSRQPEFPQQSTLDQWFDESQFESYRRLGQHVADTAFSDLDIHDPGVPLCSDLHRNRPRGAHETFFDGREHFFEDLYRIWYPTSPAVQKYSGTHADIYARLMEAVRSDKDLSSLDRVLFEDWSKANPSDPPSWQHKSSYICDAFIQLMQRVFYDLELENPAAREHPYVQGWMKIFKQWARSPQFRHTWEATNCSYPERFQHFYKEHVEGERDAQRAQPCAPTAPAAPFAPSKLRSLLLASILFMGGASLISPRKPGAKRDK